MKSRSRIVDGIFAVAALGLAVGLRLSLLDFKSIDFFNYTKVWYLTLQDTGFAAFGQGFSNYNLPYLYLLYLVVRLVPGLPAVIATKVPSLAADFVAAWFTYRIVGIKYKTSPFPALAAFAILFAPTVVLNSAFWGQADAVYGCVLLASIYYVLRRQDVPAMLLFGLAVSLKAHAIFVLPLLLALFLRGQLRWKYALLVPAVMFVCLIPAMVAGRPLLDLLLIYPAQAGQYEQLTMHAPSALSWIPESGRYFDYFYPAALILAASAAIALALAIWLSPSRLTRSLVLELALISSMLLPFLLPKMHERYFYVADLLSIIVGFYQPSLFFVPLLMITISFFAYQPTLFGVEPVPIGLLALGVFVLLVLLNRHALSRLFPQAQDS
jgi:Gpi18-like mannosyltransferase